MSQASDALLKRALEARREGRLDDAKQNLVEAIAICRTAEVQVDLAKALTGLGRIERDMGNLDAAQLHYEEAAAIYRAEGHALRLAHTIRHVGDIHRHSRRIERAESCYDEALALYRGHMETPPLELANAVRGLALLKNDSGDADTAKVLWEEARNLYGAAHVEEGVAECSQRLAVLGRG